MKNKRLLFAGIFGLVIFIIFLSDNTSLEWSFYSGLAAFAVFAILTSRSFMEWNKQDNERRIRESEIRRTAELEEQGRLRARENFKNKPRLRFI